jgi:hypothetical protein
LSHAVVPAQSVVKVLKSKVRHLFLNLQAFNSIFSQENKKAGKSTFKFQFEKGCFPQVNKTTFGFKNIWVFPSLFRFKQTLTVTTLKISATG